ncbi:hypothetical protein QFZ41_003106 [Luteibacter sp. W1I16]|uniref:hypothetical protein n=1 Tax=Luteibacter sp. W1I16 TaxID=3373922 RepID=UPI003D243A28
MRLYRLVLGAAFALALPQADARPVEVPVVTVRPSTAVVPANMLRLSLEFATAPEGPVLPRVALSRADGSELREPFLAQELWSPDGRILTVLLHPGRVKSGLVAREALGPILVPGDDVVLTLDGRPLKRWHVGPTDLHGPVESAWHVSSVRPATRQPLVVRLDAPVDGRDTGYIAIADADDRPVDGHAELRDGESTWTFTPDAPWRAGRYRLMVRGTLEDPAGNRLNGHFETPLDTPDAPAMDAAVAFDINPIPAVLPSPRTSR